MQVLTLPKNDSLVIRHRVRGTNGQYIVLTGYTFTLTVRVGDDDITPVYQTTGILDPADLTNTTSYYIIPPSTLGIPQVYNASTTALKTGTDQHTAIFQISVVDHA